ncbi:MAG: P-loop NTPase fold protein [Planctomycetota bacterium]
MEQDEPFGYWGERAPSKLLDLDTAITLASASGLRQGRHPDAANAAANAADTAANANAAADAAADAANAAVYAAVYAANAAANAAVYAADAVYANAAAAADTDAMLNDLTYLEELSGQEARPVYLIAFLNRRLWEGSTDALSLEVGNPFPDRVDHWEKALRSFDDPRLIHLATRYRRLCNGEGYDWATEDEQYPDLKLKDFLGDLFPSEVASSTQTETGGQAPERVRGVALNRPDRVAAADTLGRGPLRRVLGSMLQHPSQGSPLTMALLGDWGSGKSSFVSHLADDLVKPRPTGEGQPERVRFRVVMFDAWEYEQCDDLNAGLTQRIASSLLEDLGWGKRLVVQWRFKWRQYPSHWKQAGLWGGWAVVTLVLIAWATGGLSSGGSWWGGLGGWGGWGGWGGVGGAAGVALALGWLIRSLSHPLWKSVSEYVAMPDYGRRLGQVPVMKQHIATLCELFGIGRGERGVEPKVRKRGAEAPRLLVWIDNLDRCKEKTIVDTLDAVRLVMEVPGVFTLVAIDPAELMKAVMMEEHYGVRGREYLAKIIGLAVHLPEPSAGQVAGMIRGQMRVDESLGAAGDGGGEGDEFAGGAEVDDEPGEATDGGGSQVSGTPNEREAIDTETQGDPAGKPVPDGDRAGAGEVASSDTPASDSIDGSQEQEEDNEDAVVMACSPLERDVLTKTLNKLGANNPRRINRLINTHLFLRNFLDRVYEPGRFSPVRVLSAMLLTDELLETDTAIEALLQLTHARTVEDRVEAAEELLDRGAEVVGKLDGVLADHGQAPIGEWDKADTAELIDHARAFMLPHRRLDRVDEL